MLRLTDWLRFGASAGLLVLLAGVLIGGVMEARRSRPIRVLLSRGNMERAWLDRFPDAGREDIVRFLALFAGAFGLPKRSEFNLSPDDRVTDIYRMLYPLRGEPDCLEWESFASELSDEYEFDLASLPLDVVALGQIFAHLPVARPG
ncbi:MAG TPA: hypothetical protein VGI81_29050 [Tepidisphaeraceae bacterium]